MGVIRIATQGDSKAIADIYAPFCQANSGVSLDSQPPSAKDMERRIAITLKNYPWLVYEERGTVLGYCYADQHKPGAAYDWDADVAIYLHESIRGKGIGKMLYGHLFNGLKTLGYFNAFAAIGLPNHAAIALHESLSFTRVGVFSNVGFKSGAWRDVAWFALKLQPYDLSPQPPIKFSKLGL